jgi:hypothetical protein
MDTLGIEPTAFPDAKRVWYHYTTCSSDVRAMRSKAPSLALSRWQLQEMEGGSAVGSSAVRVHCAGIYAIALW